MISGKGTTGVSVDPVNKVWPYEMFVYRFMYLYATRKPGVSKLRHYRSRDGKVWEETFGPIKGPFDSDVCFVYPAKQLYPDGSSGYVIYYRLSGQDEEAQVPSYETLAKGRGRTRQLFRAESR